MHEFGQNLAAVRAHARAQINEMVGMCRREHLTELPLQEEVYRQKLQEARALVENVEAAPQDFPLINAEAGVTGQTPYQVAQIVLNRRRLLDECILRTEPVRMATVHLIDKSTSPAEIRAAVGAFAGLLREAIR